MHILKQRIWSEFLASLFLAILSLFCWQGILVWIGVADYIRNSLRWGDIIGSFTVCATYYLALVISLAIIRRANPLVHPLSSAYVGGWLVIIISTALSVMNPAFNEILGMSLATKATPFLIFTLVVGALRFWRESALAKSSLPATSQADVPANEQESCE